jgi:hypothetical protein
MKRRWKIDRSSIERIHGRLFCAVFGLFLPVVLLAGCQGMAGYYRGARIHPGYEIPLIGGAQQAGIYQSQHLTVDYHYSLNQSALQITGVIRFTRGVRYNFNGINRFHAGLILADDQGHILDVRGLTSSVFDAPDDGLRFSNTIALPPRTASMVFTYAGQASSRGDGGGFSEFWEYPIVRGRCGW